MALLMEFPWNISGIELVDTLRCLEETAERDSNSLKLGSRLEGFRTQMTGTAAFHTLELALEKCEARMAVRDEG
jgi:hypothetical protein